MCSTVPAEQRVEPPTPFVETSSEDPAGARRARASLYFSDPRAEPLLDAIVARTAASELSAAAGAELTFRVLVAHRTAGDGPARLEEAWVSAMPADDLAAIVTRALGPLEKRDSLLARRLHLLLAQAAFSMLAGRCGQATGERRRSLP